MKPIYLDFELDNIPEKINNYYSDNSRDITIFNRVNDFFKTNHYYKLTDISIEKRLNITIVDTCYSTEHEISYDLPLYDYQAKREEIEAIKTGLDKLVDELINNESESVNLNSEITDSDMKIHNYIKENGYHLIYFTKDNTGITLKISDGLHEFESNVIEINYDFISENFDINN
jgi:hypothetical protein